MLCTSCQCSYHSYSKANYLSAIASRQSMKENVKYDKNLVRPMTEFGDLNGKCIVDYHWEGTLR